MNDIIKRTGVKQEQIGEFCKLSMNLIEPLIRNQECVNKLNSKLTTTTEILERNLTLQNKKNNYEIRKYLKDSGQYKYELDLYINTLNQSGYITMKQIQKESKKQYKFEIYPLFAYRPSYNNGFIGRYSSNYKPNMTPFAKKLFQELCLDKEWKRLWKKSYKLTKKTQKKFKKFYGGFSNIFQSAVNKKPKQKSKACKKGLILLKHEFLCKKIDEDTDMVHCYDEEYEKIKFKLNGDSKFQSKIKKIVKKGKKKGKDVKLKVTEKKYKNDNDDDDEKDEDDEDDGDKYQIIDAFIVESESE